VTWTAVEVVRSIGAIGFPWAHLGLTQYRTPLVLPVAAVGGVFGISALIAMVNAALAAVMLRRRVTPAVLATLVTAGIIIVAAGAVQPVVGDQAHVAAAVQPNVSPLRKGDPQAAGTLLEGLLRQTDQASSAGAEIIVFPETAVPEDLAQNGGARRALARRAGGATVVIGSFLPGPANGLLVLDPAGEVLGRHAKRRLVPFGEAGLRPGREGTVVQTRQGAIGPIICYESAFAFLVRGIVAGGAEVITMATNDGWFGTSAGPAQHAAHAVLRAVETGRTVIRSANTGASMLIRPDGQIAGTLPVGAEGVLVASLPVGGATTPYVRWGWLLGPLAVVIWVVTAAPAWLGPLQRAPVNAARLALAVSVPGAVWVLGRWSTGSGTAEAAGTWPVGWWVLLLLLAATLLTGRGTLFARRGVLVSAGASFALTGLLVLAMRQGYAQYGFTLPLEAPAGGWLWGGVHLAASGVAVEAWLRGAVFAAAQRFGGWALAAGVSTGLGIALHVGAAQEVLLWHLLTGVGFSALRLWTRDAVGLGAARGLGDAAVLALAGLR
jgi:apolipoprotein N-acyltransferase